MSDPKSPFIRKVWAIHNWKPTLGELSWFKKLHILIRLYMNSSAREFFKDPDSCCTQLRTYLLAELFNR